MRLSGTSKTRKVTSTCQASQQPAQVSPCTLNQRPSAPTHRERLIAGMLMKLSHADAGKRLERAQAKFSDGRTKRCPLLERGGNFLWHPTRKPDICSSQQIRQQSECCGQRLTYRTLESARRASASKARALGQQYMNRARPAAVPDVGSRTHLDLGVADVRS